MVEDSITRLLFNALAQRQTVMLPDIGSLRFKRIAAKCEGATLTPPRNMFIFSNREEGRSLLDMLITKAGCKPNEGEEAYRRWLHRVKQTHSVVIEGVGRIEGDFFKPSEELERLLNPVTAAPITLRRRCSLRGLWFGLAAVAVVGVAGAAWWYFNMQPTSTLVVEPKEVESQKIVDELRDSVVADEVVAIITPVAEQTMPVPKEVATVTAVSNEVGKISPGTRYVVMGVFSTEENARKYIEQLSKRAPEISCRIYRFQGKKFMVSGFESVDGAEATAFIREHRAQFSDLWVYKRK